jgi:predicted O-methyltransferase YrrM
MVAISTHLVGFCSKRCVCAVVQRYTSRTFRSRRGPKNNLDSIDPVEGMSLFHLVKDNRFRHLLEVGMAGGTSTLYLAAALLEGSPEPGQTVPAVRSVSDAPDGEGAAVGRPPRFVMSIDPFQETVWGCAALDAVDRCGLAHLVQHVSSPSLLALSHLLADMAHGPGSFDLVLVDGSHLFDDVLMDCVMAVKLLRVGGVLILDDAHLYHPGVLAVAKFLRANYVHCLQLVLDAVPSSSMAIFVKTARTGDPLFVEKYSETAGVQTKRRFNFHVAF